MTETFGDLWLPRPGRNPLVVQFWLWGVDARNGDLSQCAREKTPCQRGSSVYHMEGWSVHSMGLILHGGPLLCYDRPSQMFYHCPERPSFDHPCQGHPVHRSEGLLRVQEKIQAHERWIQARRGAGYREQLLSAKLPGKVRREVEAWRQWISQDVLHLPVEKPLYRIHNPALVPAR